MEKELTIWWDRKNDFLELSIGKPVKGFFIPLKDDVLLRVNARTKKPVGIMFINFSKNFKNKSRRMKLPIKLDLKLVKKKVFA